MPFDFKKEYKEFYLPSAKPTIVTVPKANYNNYRTNYDDFRELYLFGNQIDIGETKKLDSKNC